MSLGSTTISGSGSSWNTVSLMLGGKHMIIMIDVNGINNFVGRYKVVSLITGWLPLYYTCQYLRFNLISFCPRCRVVGEIEIIHLLLCFVHYLLCRAVGEIEIIRRSCFCSLSSFSYVFFLWKYQPSCVWRNIFKTECPRHWKGGRPAAGVWSYLINVAYPWWVPYVTNGRMLRSMVINWSSTQHNLSIRSFLHRKCNFINW